MSDDKILMNFSNIVLSYAVNATIHLGLSPDPATGQIAIDLNRAKDLIDMLDVLRDKTKGNLTEDEEKIMSETLSNLKNLYINALNTDKEKEKIRLGIRQLEKDPFDYFNDKKTIKYLNKKNIFYNKLIIFDLFSHPPPNSL